MVSPSIHSSATRSASQICSGGEFAKLLAERIDVAIFNFQSTGRRVAAVAEEQMRASGQCLVNLEARHAAHRADARLHAHFVLGDQHHGPMIFFRQPARHDADDAGMPAAAGKHQRRIVGRIELLLQLLVGRQINAALQTVAAAVQFVQIFGQRGRSLGRRWWSAVRRPTALDPIGPPHSGAGRV